MPTIPSNICPICRKSRTAKGTNHERCRKSLQRQFAEANKLQQQKKAEKHGI